MTIDYREINKNVLAFKRKSDDALTDAYGKGVKRFILNEELVPEMMMRIGIEARITGASNEDEYRILAIASLQNDYLIRNKQNNEMQTMR